MIASKTFPSKPHAIQGITLIEVMVSMVIGLLLIAGAFTVYLQSRDTYRTSDATARVQEVGRYALDVLERDVRLAGYWGLIAGPSVKLDHQADAAETQDALDALVTGNCGNNWIVDLNRYVDGRDSIDTMGSGYDLDCAATNPVTWSDVLIVRRASSNAVAADGTKIQIQTNRLIGEIFHSGTIPASYDPAPSSETHDLVVHAYYVSEVLPSPNGLRQFSLRRQTLIGGATPSIQDQEVIPGIQDLQIQFGIDNNVDGSADWYANPESPDIAANDRIVSVRIWLLAMAEENDAGFVDNRPYDYANGDLGPFNDSRRRTLITKTVQLRNGRVCQDDLLEPVVCP